MENKAKKMDQQISKGIKSYQGRMNFLTFLFLALAWFFSALKGHMNRYSTFLSTPEFVSSKE